MFDVIVIFADCTVRTTDNECCVFPFMSDGERHFTCISYSFGRKWCATTYDYDKDGKWGKCLGLFKVALVHPTLQYIIYV